MFALFLPFPSSKKNVHVVIKWGVEIYLFILPTENKKKNVLKGVKINIKLLLVLVNLKHEHFPTRKKNCWGCKKIIKIHEDEVIIQVELLEKDNERLKYKMQLKSRDI